MIAELIVFIAYALFMVGVSVVLHILIKETKRIKKDLKFLTQRHEELLKGFCRFREKTGLFNVPYLWHPHIDEYRNIGEELDALLDHLKLEIKRSKANATVIPCNEPPIVGSVYAKEFGEKKRARRK